MFRSWIQTFLSQPGVQRRMAQSPSIVFNSNPIESVNGHDAQSSDASYKNAVKLLNTLQSNAETIAKARQNREIKRLSNFPQTVGALEAAGIGLDMLDKLNVIHVAGTKGKGTTCAFTESILREAGLKTGFFSSPHLISVRERIRINGNPLSEDAFANHFYSVYNQVKHLKEPGAPFEMPHYFRFLTCMAFHVFLKEQVDVAIMEVGIGGMYDTTNVIRKPVVVGITSLGLEHQVLLGDTLEEIALQKAGIMKEGIPAYTVESHPPHIVELLRSHASTVKCPIYLVKSENFKNGKVPVKLGVNDGIVSEINSGLAIHLANEFLLQKRSYLFPSLPANPISAAELTYSKSEHFLPFHIKGLEKAKWDGRFQIIDTSDRLKYFLDGAHTSESITITLQWFSRVTSDSAFRILVFNITGERPAANFLQPFASNGLFNLAVFCPIVTSSKSKSLDNWAALDSGKKLTEICESHLQIWRTLEGGNDGVVCPCAESTVDYVRHLAGRENMTDKPIHVLITGSLRLVGAFLAVLDPEINK